jgi:hypothetical protein
VNFGHASVGCARNNRAGQDFFAARRRLPRLPKAGHDHLTIIGHCDRVGLFFLALGIEHLPLVVAVGDDETPLATTLKAVVASLKRDVASP